MTKKKVKEREYKESKIIIKLTSFFNYLGENLKKQNFHKNQAMEEKNGQ